VPLAPNAGAHLQQEAGAQVGETASEVITAFSPGPPRTGHTTFEVSGSPVPMLRKVKAIGLTPTRTPSLPGSLLPFALGFSPLWTAFPSADYYASSVTLG
jgi:hypothetical protein